MMNKLMLSGFAGLLLLAGLSVAQQQLPVNQLEDAVNAAATSAAVAQSPAAGGANQQEESYQRVYEAFTRLMQGMSNQSLGNVRRLVSRINQLVGSPAPATSGQQQQQQQIQQQEISAIDERTEQILNRLDRVTRDTDQHTLSQLNEDVSRLISTLNDAYLRNIRRVIERVNRVVGQPPSGSQLPLHQSGDRLDDAHTKLPGFPGWDEFIVAMDRMQKSLASMVRSTTRLLTSGRR